MYTWLEWDVITCNDSWYITVYIVDIVDILPLYLVGGWATPLKKMSSSVGMMTFPTEWKNKNHVPDHQSVIILGYIGIIVYVGICYIHLYTILLKYPNNTTIWYWDSYPIISYCG